LDLTGIVEKTVADYYNLNEDQRSFITVLANDMEADYNRTELIKALMLFNYSVENNLQMNDPKIDEFVASFDENTTRLNALINEQDQKYRISRNAH
jgi:hypothetical protein